MVRGTADQMDLTENGSVATFHGNVVFSEDAGRIQIYADSAIYDARTKEYALRGNVRVSAK